MSVAPEAPPPAAASDPRTVAAWFTGPVPPAKLSPLYRVGLVATAFAMVLLPLLYLAFVGGVVALALVWMRYGLAVLDLVRGWIGLAIYAAPLLVGFFAVCFLLKPLFAPPRKRPEPVAIDLEKEPAFAAFVRGVCRAVRAPMPTVVYVDANVNASAGFRRGWRSLFRRELALTIGLPLVAGLDVRQFAGVLAHEFGHFSQHAGLSASFVIRSINNWLARVVYERDAWDTELVEATNRGHLFGIVVAALTQAVVFVSRKVLGGLLNLGHAISCFQLRQMEFDADRCAIHIAGSAAHIATSVELELLGRAYRDAITDLQKLWQDRRLPEDFPALVLRRRRNAPQAPSAPPPPEPSPWFHTHPSPELRNRRAQEMNTTGLFQGAGAATALFRDFPALAKTTSHHFYTKEIGLDLKEVAVADAAELAHQVDAEREALEAWTTFAGQVLALERPIGLAAHLRAALDNSVTPVDRRPLHATLAEHRTSFEKLETAWRKHLSAECQAIVAGHLIGAGIGIAPGAFGVVGGTAAAAETQRQECATRREATAVELRCHEETLRKYLGATIGLAIRQAQQAPYAQAVVAAANAFVEVEPLTERYGALALELSVARTLAAAPSQLLAHPGYRELSVGTQRRLIAAFNETLATAKTLRDPFRRQPKSGWTLANHLRNLLPQEASSIEVRTAALLQAISSVYFRLLSEIHFYGSKLEPVLSASRGGSSPVTDSTVAPSAPEEGG